MDFRILEAAYGIYLDRLDRKIGASRDPDKVLRMLEDPDTGMTTRRRPL